MGGSPPDGCWCDVRACKGQCCWGCRGCCLASSSTVRGVSPAKCMTYQASACSLTTSDCSWQRASVQSDFNHSVCHLAPQLACTQDLDNAGLHVLLFDSLSQPSSPAMLQFHCLQEDDTCLMPAETAGKSASPFLPPAPQMASSQYMISAKTLPPHLLHSCVGLGRCHCPGWKAAMTCCS